MTRIAVLLALFSLTACGASGTASNAAREPGAPVAAPYWGREIRTAERAERPYEARQAQHREPQQAREPRSFSFECRACSR